MRVFNWRPKLDEFIESNRHTPFKWGVFDCALFAAKAIEIQTDVNFYERYLDQYDSKKTAIRSLQAIDNVSSVIDLVDKYFNRTNKINTGDIVCTNFGVGPTLGICLGLHDVFAGKDGLLFYDIHKVENPIRWRI